MPIFEVDTNVLYQTGLGALSVITTSGFPTSMPSPPTCVGLASDTSSVFCRSSAGNVVSWSTSGIGPTMVYTGVPVGAASNDLAVDFSYFYIVDDPGTPASAAIRRFVRSPGTIDAGPPTFTDIVTGRTAPSDLEYGSVSGRLFWVETDITGGTGTMAFTSSPPATAVTSAIPGLRYVAPDPSTSSYVWFASPTGIYKASTFTFQVSTCRQNLVGIGGLAVDFSYFYWTASDGGVYPS
jgi:hypothetical protein